MANNAGEGNLSLRTLVAENKDAMHDMASRFGEVNTLKKELSSLVANLSKHDTAVTSIQTYNSGVDSVRKEVGKLTSIVGLGENGLTLIGMLEQETICRRKLEQKIDLVLNRSIKKLRYAYGAIVVLVLILLAGSLFCGYQLYDLKHSVTEASRSVESSNKDVPVPKVVLSDSEGKLADKPHAKGKSR